MLSRVVEVSVTLRRVLESAARLQSIVPDAVLVGGSAAALYAGHRDSFDHDHVLADLADRYEMVLDAVEAADGWATSVRASKPPFTIIGSLDGVRAGLRQMRRIRPLETARIDIGDGAVVVAPTENEALRVKAFLVVQRNAVRDFLDVVALADVIGEDAAAGVLADIGGYYADRSNDPGVGVDFAGGVARRPVAERRRRDRRTPAVQEPRLSVAPLARCGGRVSEAGLATGGCSVSGLCFHNVDADPTDDVRSWPYESLVTAIDHGLVPDWRPIFAEIRRSPWGLTASRVERYLGYRDPDGVSTLFTLALEHARQTIDPSDQTDIGTDSG